MSTDVNQIAGLVTGWHLIWLVVSYVVVPYITFRVALLCWPKDHERRREFLAEYDKVAIGRRPFWVAQVVMRSVIDGTAARIGVVRDARRLVPSPGARAPVPLAASYFEWPSLEESLRLMGVARDRLGDTATSHFAMLVLQYGLAIRRGALVEPGLRDGWIPEWVGLSEFAGLAVLVDGFWILTDLGKAVARIFLAEGDLPDGVDPQLAPSWYFDRQWVQQDLAEPDRLFTA